jgi:hypothetical protein
MPRETLRDLNLLTKHSHNWRIDEAEGPTSKGRCVDKPGRKGCGATRLFRNWLPDADFITNTEHRYGV